MQVDTLPLVPMGVDTMEGGEDAGNAKIDLDQEDCTDKHNFPKSYLYQNYCSSVMVNPKCGKVIPARAHAQAWYTVVSFQQLFQ